MLINPLFISEIEDCMDTLNFDPLLIDPQLQGNEYGNLTRRVLYRPARNYSVNAIKKNTTFEFFIGVNPEGIVVVSQHRNPTKSDPTIGNLIQKNIHEYLFEKSDTPCLESGIIKIIVEKTSEFIPKTRE